MPGLRYGPCAAQGGAAAAAARFALARGVALPPTVPGCRAALLPAAACSDLAGDDDSEGGGPPLAAPAGKARQGTLDLFLKKGGAAGGSAAAAGKAKAVAGAAKPRQPGARPEVVWLAGSVVATAQAGMPPGYSLPGSMQLQLLPLSRSSLSRPALHRGPCSAAARGGSAKKQKKRTESESGAPASIDPGSCGVLRTLASRAALDMRAAVMRARLPAVVMAPLQVPACLPVSCLTPLGLATVRDYRG